MIYPTKKPPGWTCMQSSSHPSSTTGPLCGGQSLGNLTNSALHILPMPVWAGNIPSYPEFKHRRLHPSAPSLEALHSVEEGTAQAPPARGVITEGQVTNLSRPHKEKPGSLFLNKRTLLPPCSRRWPCSKEKWTKLRESPCVSGCSWEASSIGTPVSEYTHEGFLKNLLHHIFTSIKHGFALIDDCLNVKNSSFMSVPFGYLQVRTFYVL